MINDVGGAAALLLACMALVGIPFLLGLAATDAVMSRYLYARVDTPGRRQYKYLIDYVSPRQGAYMILKAHHRQQYFVLNTIAWWATGYPAVKNLNTGLQMLKQMDVWLHQTAERFDTLEQAMLYFEMVRS